jgi:cell division protein FtsB
MGLPLILVAATAGMQVLSGFQQASAQRQQAAAQQQQYEATAKQQNYQAQVAENNKTTAEQNARVTAAAGEQAALNQGLKTRQAVGAMVAGQAASGINLDGGSALDVRTSEKQIGQLDALTIRSNAMQNAYGYEVQASNFGADADLSRMGANNNILAGKNAKAAGDTAATGSILGGLTGAAGTVYGGYSSGAFGSKKPAASGAAVF